MIYLEISPRQSGKSTRLMDAVHATWADYPKIFPVVFAFRSEVIKNLKFIYEKKYGRMPKQISFISFQNALAFDFGQTPGPYFFDEFDFYETKVKLYNQLTGSELNRAYFCTTPRIHRSITEIHDVTSKDLLCKLLQYNNGNCEKYQSKTVNNAKSYLSPDQYDLEINGNFIK